MVFAYNPRIPALGRQKQKDQEFEASLGYTRLFQTPIPWRVNSPPAQFWAPSWLPASYSSYLSSPEFRIVRWKVFKKK